MTLNDYNKITISDSSTDTFTISDQDILQIDSNLVNSTTTWSIDSNMIGLDTISITDYGYSNVPLDVRGDAHFHGDLKIQGQSLLNKLEKIEEKLAILHPNEELESRWEELRNLRKQYMELEKEIIEKEKVWEILKR